MKLPFRDLLRDDNSLYLRRYTLLRLPFFKIRLHHIFLSDYYCLHDHPWDFVSVILKGGYYEVRPKEALRGTFTIRWAETKWMNPGRVLFRRAEDKHRLQIPIGKTCWTLVFMFRRRREWGFWKKDEFIHHTKYDSKQKCE